MQPYEKYPVFYEIHHELDDPVHKLTPHLSEIYFTIILSSVIMQ
jgi:hypothetical protein